MSSMPEALAAGSAGLEEALRLWPAGDMDAERVVGMYHRVMGVSSMCSALEQAGECGPDVLAEAARIRGVISERFDSGIHAEILGHLEGSVSSMMAALQGEGGSPEAFDDLRKEMSTLEFVRQYQKGLA